MATDHQQLSLPDQLKSVFHRVKGHFVEWSDRGERWDMPPPNYDGTQFLRDDCDGFCLACRSLLHKLNINSRLVYCEVAGIGHLVVEVRGWILDNRQNTVIANTVLSKQNYRWLRISGFSSREPWREIVNS